MKEERVEFSTVREDYNVYRVENGQILKVKLALLDVINVTQDNGQVRSSIKTQLQSPVITPEGIDISGLDLAPSGQTAEKDQTKELNFETVKEITNIYETKKSFIFTGIKMEKIFATNKKNEKNEPLLRFTSITGIDVMQKPIFDPNANIPTVNMP